MHDEASRRQALVGFGAVGTSLAIATRAEGVGVDSDVLVSTDFGTLGAASMSTVYSQGQVDALVQTARLSGKPIYWPSGVHYIDGRISFSFPLTMIGAGSQLIGPRRELASNWRDSDFNGTVLVFRQQRSDGYLATVNAAPSTSGAALPTLTIRGLTILGPPGSGAVSSSAGMQLGSYTTTSTSVAVRCRIDDVNIANFSVGIRGVLENCTINSLYVVGCGTGLDLLPATNGNVFSGLNIEFCTRSALRMSNADGNVFLGGVIQNNDGTTDPIIKLNGACQGNTFTGIYFENRTTGSGRYSIVSVGEGGATCYGIEFLECHWGTMPDAAGRSIPGRLAFGYGSVGCVVRARGNTFRAVVDAAAAEPTPVVTIFAPGRGNMFEGGFREDTFEGASERQNTIINTDVGLNYQRLNRTIVRTYRDAGGDSGTPASQMNRYDELFVIGNRRTDTITLPASSTLPDGWSVQVIASAGGGINQRVGVAADDQVRMRLIRSKSMTTGELTTPIAPYESKTFIWMNAYKYWVAY